MFGIIFVFLLIDLRILSLDLKDKLSIGCAMIVRNAEKTIERAIRSVIPICRQIVVVDTGSFDSTPSIASRLGAEVHFFEWINDFSAARNYSLKFLRTDWAIILDSDEELVADSIYNDISLFDIKNLGGIRLTLRNFLSSGNSGFNSEEKEDVSITEHKYTRIIRHKSFDGYFLNFQFRGKIHEQISDSIQNKGFEIFDSNIIINHYGYFEKNTEKIKRNLELIQSELDNQPEDIWLKFHLAETYFTAGNINEAEELFLSLFENYHQNPNNYPIEHYEMVRLRLSQIELQRNNFVRAEEFLDFVSNDTNREGLRLYILTVINLLNRNFEKAKEFFKNPDLQNSTMITKKQLGDIKIVINEINK
ncbi:MAG: glycosyltransferase [Candidatus Kapabacteria bacterium]|nr:glycosyltransferase [Candidatus Kapabacteria bacterium]